MEMIKENDHLILLRKRTKVLFKVLDHISNLHRHQRKNIPQSLKGRDLVKCIDHPIRERRQCREVLTKNKQKN